MFPALLPEMVTKGSLFRLTLDVEPGVRTASGSKKVAAVNFSPVDPLNPCNPRPETISSGTQDTGSSCRGIIGPSH